MSLWRRLAPSDEADLPTLVELAVRLGAAGVGHEAVRRRVAARLSGGDAAAPDVVLAELARTLPADRTAAEQVARRLLALGARVLVAGRPGYPARLAPLWPELGAPLWLFARAPGPLPDGPAVAIVGTRHPTADGLATAAELAAFLAARGVVVVSGMARGIDQAAHRGALGVGGRTVGVLGTGFGVEYPRGAGGLAEQVRVAGGLVTELVPGTPPRAHQFLLRNRILSGLADAIVVVEGRSRSGALATARLGAAQGRDVWAVPGSLRQPTSRAPLDLLRDGARPLTRFDDVLADLAVPEVGAPGRDPAPPAGTARPDQPRDLPEGPLRAVAGALSAVPMSAGALSSATGLDLAAVLAALSDLESRGLACGTARGWTAAP